MPDDLHAAPPRRILVVEDHELIGLLLAEMLEELGHEVCGVACTQEAAIVAAAEQHPDLIITDVRLGRGSGLAAMAEILRQNYVPHIFMSGDFRSLDALGPNAAVLEKPFQREDLECCIHRALNTASPRASNQSA